MHPTSSLQNQLNDMRRLSAVGGLHQIAGNAKNRGTLRHPTTSYPLNNYHHKSCVALLHDGVICFSTSEKMTEIICHQTKISCGLHYVIFCATHTLVCKTVHGMPSPTQCTQRYERNQLTQRVQSLP
jgi:hypothetical protein